MNKDDIKQIAKIPEKDVLEFLLRNVNLTHKEKQVFELYIINDYTEEECAEKLDKSVNTIKNWKKAMYDKIIKVWEKDTIVNLLLNN